MPNGTDGKLGGQAEPGKYIDTEIPGAKDPGEAYDTRYYPRSAFGCWPAGTPTIRGPRGVVTYFVKDRATVTTREERGPVTVQADGATTCIIVPRFLHTTYQGTLVYFATDRNAVTSDYDIYVATRNGNTYSNVGAATELNSTAYDAHPRLTADGLTMYFSSMRTTGGAQGGADIWTATRTATSQPFGTPTRVAELNTAQNESPTWISDDGCEIYLQSNRPNNVGTQDIWVAVKPL
jgi:hypothetical protein